MFQSLTVSLALSRLDYRNAVLVISLPVHLVRRLHSTVGAECGSTAGLLYEIRGPSPTSLLAFTGSVYHSGLNARYGRPDVQSFTREFTAILGAARSGCRSAGISCLLLPNLQTLKRQ